MLLTDRQHVTNTQKTDGTDAGQSADSDITPYSRQDISEEDIAAVTQVLRSDYLTQGPVGGEFEHAFAQRHKVAHAIATCNATAALHIACLALGIGAGIHLQPFYRARGFAPGDFPAAEAYYRSALSLPLFPAMTEDQQDRVVDTLLQALG